MEKFWNRLEESLFQKDFLKQGIGGISWRNLKDFPMELLEESLKNPSENAHKIFRRMDALLKKLLNESFENHLDVLLDIK